MGDWNATVPTFTAHQKAPGPSFQILADIATALTGAWSTWSPTLTNLTLGAGTVTAQYRRIGMTGDFYFKFVYGAGSAVGTGPTFSLPFSLAAHYYVVVNAQSVGGGTLLDNGTATRPAFLHPQTATTVKITQLNATPAFLDITATSPWTWTTSDSLQVLASGLELA